MGWFDRVVRINAGARVTRASKREALSAFDELNTLGVERDRLIREGLPEVATIVGFEQNVAATTVGAWHELSLDVELAGGEPYRATRRVALELSTAPHIAVGARVPVRVDPKDRSTVLVVTQP
ncbi:hypothetical protein [Mycolicibacterium gadium]|uniref:Uncharacterized protein n=1 Tax=Mycolicibacterium gadium TaxID=1794 RepID=A0A7I7WLP9_MYCGU|nr:hypothetical protein [Mycolicibacterium gadium]BBZ16768.1 hypothetical protein MGAD_11030 [Mycolicibacterium gadium]